jgi:hypothetical protein
MVHLTFSASSLRLAAESATVDWLSYLIVCLPGHLLRSPRQEVSRSRWTWC